jgi:3-phosphoshikimate 1-carboxyvinyltransferase
LKAKIRPSRLSGKVTIPGSKSHTIRAVAFAALADGKSRIEAPLESADTLSAVTAYRAAGARIVEEKNSWTINGVAGDVQAPSSTVDIGNSGTTIRVAIGSFALLRSGAAVLTGDEQIQRRPAGPLGKSLNDLGATVKSVKANGCAPFEVRGRLRGGETSIEAVTSQYLTSLLINTPLADGESRIHVPLLNEAPYVGITLDWLKFLGIRYECADDMSEFSIPGGQEYKAFERRIPADFSSATFFLAAGAIPGNKVISSGLDMSDSQGDKAVVDYIRAMGAHIRAEGDAVMVSGARLDGCEIDLNATPDALPMMAALACFAEGKTRLVNAPQVRIKETDRIEVMARELSKMGATVSELEAGLVVDRAALKGAAVEGHGDHRVVMALAVAATAAEGETTINGAEAVSVTFPGFFDILGGLGAEVELVD